MRRMRTIVIAVLLLSLIPVTAGAITNGSEDTGDEYPFVGLVAFYVGVEYSHRCSGTLLSSTVVLTAAHCTDGTTSAYAYFDFEVPADFRTKPTGVPGIPYTHPDYNPRTLIPDVGVVVLDDSAGVGGPYPTLPSVGLLSTLKADKEIQDDEFVAVGYGGVTGHPPPVLSFDLKRRYATSPYSALTQNNLRVQQNPNVNDSGGTCFGDSGGPHFWNDTLVVVSVTSWGDAICRAHDMTQRTDLAKVLSFVNGFLSS